MSLGNLISSALGVPNGALSLDNLKRQLTDPNTPGKIRMGLNQLLADPTALGAQAADALLSHAVNAGQPLVQQPKPVAPVFSSALNTLRTPDTLAQSLARTHAKSPGYESLQNGGVLDPNPIITASNAVNVLKQKGQDVGDAVSGTAGKYIPHFDFPDWATNPQFTGGAPVGKFLQGTLNFPHDLVAGTKNIADALANSNAPQSFGQRAASIGGGGMSLANILGVAMPGHLGVGRENPLEAARSSEAVPAAPAFQAEDNVFRFDPAQTSAVEDLPGSGPRTLTRGTYGDLNSAQLARDTLGGNQASHGIALDQGGYRLFTRDGSHVNMGSVPGPEIPAEPLQSYGAPAPPVASAAETHGQATPVQTPTLTSVVDPITDGLIPMGAKPIPEAHVPTAQDRGLITTIKSDIALPEAAQGPPNPLGAKLDSTYTPQSNAESKALAKDIMAQGVPEAEKFLASAPPSAQKTGVLFELLDHYKNAGDFESQARVVNDYAPELTSSGQATQAVAMRNKYSDPSRAAQYLGKKIKELTGEGMSPEDAEAITKLSENVANAKTAREGDIAQALLKKYVADKRLAGPLEKVNLYHTMSLLMNPKTIIRNILGNSMFAGAEGVSQTLGTGLDAVLAKSGLGAKIFGTGAGERTLMLPSLPEYLKGATEHGARAAEDIGLGINTSPFADNGKYEIPRGSTFKSPVGQGLEKGMRYALDLPDQVAAGGRFQEAAMNQMRAKNTGLPPEEQLTTPTPEMFARAKQEAQYATFHDKSVGQQVGTKLRDLLDTIGVEEDGTRYGLGKVLAKFAPMGGNLISKGADYSPIGIVKALKGAFTQAEALPAAAQREFVQQLSRGITGSGGMGVAYMLAKNGLVTGRKDQDPDVNAANTQAGSGNYRINLSATNRWLSGESPDWKQGDNVVSWDWAQPLSNTGEMATQLAQGGGSTAAEGLLSSFLSPLDVAADQPLMTGISRMLQPAPAPPKGTTSPGDPNVEGPIQSSVGNSPLVQGIRDALLQVPASFIPSLFNQIRQMTDNTSRDTKSDNPLEQMTNSIMYRVPGLSKLLPPQVTTLGQEKELYQNGTNNPVNVLFDPAFITKWQPSPEQQMVLDMVRKSGDTTALPRTAPRSVQINTVVDGKDVPQQVNLSPDQYVAFAKYTGEATRRLLANNGEKLKQLYLLGQLSVDSKGNSSANLKQSYDTLSPQGQADVLKGMLSDIAAAAKVDVLGAQRTGTDLPGQKIKMEGMPKLHLPVVNPFDHVTLIQKLMKTP